MGRSAYVGCYLLAFGLAVLAGFGVEPGTVHFGWLAIAAACAGLAWAGWVLPGPPGQPLVFLLAFALALLAAFGKDPGGTQPGWLAVACICAGLAYGAVIRPVVVTRSPG